MTSIQTNPQARPTLNQPIQSSADKKAEWFKKSAKCPWEIAGKVTLVALAAILALSLAIAGIIGLVKLGAFTLLSRPCLNQYDWIGNAGLGVVGSIALIGSAIGSVIGLWFLLNIPLANYRNPKTAARELKSLRTAKSPISLDKFKRLHRYGLISDSELKQRQNLEKLDIERYHLKFKIKKIPSQIESQKEIMRKYTIWCKNAIKAKRVKAKFLFPSQKNRITEKVKAIKAKIEAAKATVEARIEALETEEKGKEGRLAEILRQFEQFQKSIVTFTPHNK